jgi:hypothetical protein
MRIRVIAAVTLCSACLALPAAAEGARIELAAGTSAVVYTGGPGEVNSPLLQRFQDWFYVQDSTGPLTERVPPCEPNPEPGGLGVSSRCPAAGVVEAVVDLGDQDDFGDVDQNTLLFIPVTVLGGHGRDRISMHSLEGNVLDGGPGDDVITSEILVPTSAAGPGDTVIGGEGDDQITTRNDRHDYVQCGPGLDIVTADELDDVAADCETVNLPPGSAWVRADGKPIGVSINNGAAYTRTPHVRLIVRAPDGATQLRISNDDGFSSWVTRPVKRGEVYPYVLPAAEGEPSTRTVYVRFDGPGLDPDRTVTDDIVLDQTRPVVRSARFLGHARARVRIALRARDDASGVKSAQFARNRGEPWTPVSYRTRMSLRRTPRWARVRDGAGKAAGWRRVGR